MPMARTAPPTEPSHDLLGEMRLNKRMLSDKRANAVSARVARPQKDEDGKEIEMKSICHLDSMDFYNKQYYKLIAILRTIG